MPPNQYSKTVQTRAIATAVISAFGVTGKSKERDAGEWCDGVIQGEHVTLKCMTPPEPPPTPPPILMCYCITPQLQIIHSVRKCALLN